jgi:hypothetical protein
MADVSPLINDRDLTPAGDIRPSDAANVFRGSVDMLKFGHELSNPKFHEKYNLWRIVA